MWLGYSAPTLRPPPYGVQILCSSLAIGAPPPCRRCAGRAGVSVVPPSAPLRLFRITAGGRASQRAAVLGLPAKRVSTHPSLFKLLCIFLVLGSVRFSSPVK